MLQHHGVPDDIVILHGERDAWHINSAGITWATAGVRSVEITVVITWAIVDARGVGTMEGNTPETAGVKNAEATEVNT